MNSIKKEDGDSLYYRARLMYYNKEYAEAEVLLRSALGKNSKNDGHIYYMLAKICIDKGRNEEAKELLKKCIKKDKNNKKALLKLSNIHRKLGNVKLSAQLYNEYKKIDSKYESKKSNNKKFRESLKNNSDNILHTPTKKQENEDNLEKER